MNTQRLGLPSSLIFQGLVVGLLIWGVATHAAAGDVVIGGPDKVLLGDRPGLAVSGLQPRSEVLVETYRFAEVSVNKSGAWSTIRPLFHANARYWSDPNGKVEIDHAAPIEGTYSGVDPRGLLWSGAVVGRSPEGDAPPDVTGLDQLKDRQVRIIVRINGRVAASRDLTLKRWADDVQFTKIDTPELVGVFAAPAGAKAAPTVILLHGSEGGTFEAAEAQAGLYASHGYAAFALIYFSWPYEHVPNAPQGFSDLPVERIDGVRRWLTTRAEADTSRLALVGGSKGAEFALLAASLYPWVKAAVACVPSSIVWGGFGAPAGHHGESFTFKGAPTPFVPYGDYGPVERHEITSAERHRRDRAAASSAAVEAATIPVERSAGRFLLISGGRDAVWPSDAMAAEIIDRLERNGRGDHARWLSYPDAGHFLCGTGSAPVRYDEDDEGARGGGLIGADGRDPGQAWENTLMFLKAAL